jgi:hypothetical protein
MSVLLPYINHRTYVHGSTFIGHTLKVLQVKDSLDVHFHRISKSHSYDMRIRSSPLPKDDFNVTGCVDDKLYFGFRELDDVECLSEVADEDPSLDGVDLVRLPWVCSTVTRNRGIHKCDATQQLLLGNMKLCNLSVFSLGVLSLDCGVSVRGQLVRGAFYAKGLEVANAVELVRPKHG